MKLGIDLGARNVKIATEIQGVIKKESFKSLATTKTFGLDNIVSFKNNMISLGTGESLIEQNKTERKYLEETILLSSYKLFGTKKPLEVELGLGLPIHTYKSNKRAMMQLKLNAMVGTTVNGLVNGEEVSIKINSANIFAEGYSAFLAVEDELAKAPTTFIDWGYKTTDIINLAIEDGSWALQAVHTVPVGVFDMLSYIKEEIYNHDVDLTHEQIDQYLMHSPNIPTQHGAINLRSYLIKGKPVAEKVFQELKVVMPGALSSNIYFCGGGATNAKILLEGDYSNIFTLADNSQSLYANAIGYLLQIK